MNPTAHIIRRQNVQLRISRSSNALALQQRFLRVMNEQVLPKLEQMFDRIAGPEEWIEIDRLEVDVGALAPDEKEEIWVKNILSAYTKALEKQLPKGNTRRNTPAAQQGELLWYFLEHGLLPWWGVGQNLEEVVKNSLPRIAPLLPDKLVAHAARRRWMRRFDDDLQWEALDTLLQKQFSGQNRANLIPLTLETWQRWFPDAPGHVVRNAYWESVWEASLQLGNFVARWPVLLVVQGMACLPERQESAERLFEAAFRFNDFAKWPTTFQSVWLQAVMPAVQKAFGVLSDAQRRTKSRKMVAKLRRYAGQFPSHHALFSALLEELHPASKTQNESPGPDMAQPTELKHSKKSEAFSEPDGIFVPLAGAVLLHPFLPAFFEQNGLLFDGHFRDTAAQERAVHLLYHVCTGLQHPAEEELPLIKLLCGMPIEQPVERFIEVTEKERSQTLQMLGAITEHWQVLTGVSPDELRGSFFIREGKLRSGEMGLYLTVEEKTLDILLTTLPWGLSPILHTWMKEMLWVEWV
jgi:Contractile injection system tape measure protein